MHEAPIIMTHICSDFRALFLSVIHIFSINDLICFYVEFGDKLKRSTNLSSDGYNFNSMHIRNSWYLIAKFVRWSLVEQKQFGKWEENWKKKMVMAACGRKAIFASSSIGFLPQSHVICIFSLDTLLAYSPLARWRKWKNNKILQMCAYERKAKRQEHEASEHSESSSK